MRKRARAFLYQWFIKRYNKEETRLEKINIIENKTEKPGSWYLFPSGSIETKIKIQYNQQRQNKEKFLFLKIMFFTAITLLETMNYLECQTI